MTLVAWPALPATPCHEGGGPDGINSWIPRIRAIIDRTLASRDAGPTASSGPPNPRQVCIARIKQAILGNQVRLISPRLPESEAELKRINAAISASRESPDSGKSRTTYVRGLGKSGEAIMLAMDRTYNDPNPNSKGRTIHVDYRIYSSLPFLKDNPIGVELTADIYARGKTARSLVSSTDEQQIINPTTCGGVLQHLSELMVSYQGTKAHLLQTDWSADGGVEHHEEDVSRHLLDASTRSATRFGGFDDPTEHVVAQRLARTVAMRDPLVGKIADFTLWRIRTFSESGRSVKEVDQARSPASPYTIKMRAESPGVDDPTAPAYEEGISRDLWSQTRLDPLASEDHFRSQAFSGRETLAPAFEYAIQSNLALSFPGIARYGTVVPVEPRTPAQVTGDSGTRANLALSYHFTSRPAVSLPDPEPIDVRKYTAENPLYDYRSPGVARLVEQIRSQHLSDRHQQAMAILRLVNQVIPAYDQSMIQYDTVRPLSASEVVKNRRGICQNFAALFITLARALGIPARMIVGIGVLPTALDGSSDTVTAQPHAWAEISLDDRSWTPVETEDPEQLGLPARGYLPLRESQYYDNAVKSPSGRLVARWGPDWSYDVTKVGAD